MSKGASTQECLRLRRLCQRKQATINRLQDEITVMHNDIRAFAEEVRRLHADNAAARLSGVIAPHDDPAPPNLWRRFVRWLGRP